MGAGRDLGRWCLATFALIVAGVWPTHAVHAKVRGSIAVAILDGVEAVVLVERMEDGAPRFVVEKSYVGPLTVGARLPIAAEADKKYFNREFAGERLPRKFVLFLHKGQTKGWTLGSGWTFDPMVSTPIARGKSYVSMMYPAGAPTDADELARVEELIARGVLLRTQLQKAQAEREPLRKLELLRSMFLLPADDFDGHYDLFFAMDHALREVETAGPAAIPFLRGLIEMPHFQESYRSRDWLNFGRMAREKIQKVLKKVQKSG